MELPNLVVKLRTGLGSRNGDGVTILYKSPYFKQKDTCLAGKRHNFKLEEIIAARRGILFGPLPERIES